MFDTLSNNILKEMSETKPVLVKKSIPNRFTGKNEEIQNI